MADFQVTYDQVIELLARQGYLLSTDNRVNPEDPNTAAGIGSMIIDLIMVTENFGLSFTECLQAGYLVRGGTVR